MQLSNERTMTAAEIRGFMRTVINALHVIISLLSASVTLLYIWFMAR